MSDTSDKIEAISEYLSQPKEVQTDSGKVVNHSVDDLIKAVNFLKKNAITDDEETSSTRRMGFYRVRNRD